MGVHMYSDDTLSPLSGSFTAKTQFTAYGSMINPQYSPPKSINSSPRRIYGVGDADALSIGGSEGTQGPFNFQPVTYAPERQGAGKPVRVVPA